MCVCVCMYVFCWKMHAQLMRLCMYVCMYVCVCLQGECAIYVYMHVYMYVYIHLRMYVFGLVSMYLHMYSYHTKYIHTYMNTYCILCSFFLHANRKIHLDQKRPKKAQGVKISVLRACMHIHTKDAHIFTHIHTYINAAWLKMLIHIHTCTYT